MIRPVLLADVLPARDWPPLPYTLFAVAVFGFAVLMIVWVKRRRPGG